MQIWISVFEFLFAFDYRLISSSSSLHYLWKFASQLGMLFFLLISLVFVSLNFKRKLTSINDTPDLNVAVSFFLNFENRFVYMDLCCVYNRFCPLLFRFRWLIFNHLFLNVGTIVKIGTEHTLIVIPTVRNSVSLLNRILFARFLSQMFDKTLLQSHLRAQFHKKKIRFVITAVPFNRLFVRSPLDFIKINTNSIFVSASLFAIQCFFLAWIELKADRLL